MNHYKTICILIISVLALNTYLLIKSIDDKREIKELKTSVETYQNNYAQISINNEPEWYDEIGTDAEGPDVDPEFVY